MKKQLSVKAIQMCSSTGMPRKRARRSFSRIASMVRPKGERRINAIAATAVGHHRGVTEPVSCCRHLATVALADVGDELLDARHARLLPIPLEHPDADARLGRHGLERLKLLLQAGDVDLLFDAELRHLLQTVDHV